MFTPIDPILELELPSKVKPKRQLLDAKNKKQSEAQAGLDESTRRELSRFEHDKAQGSYSTRVVVKNSNKVIIAKKKITKQTKFYEKIELLESHAKYNF